MLIKHNFLFNFSVSYAGGGFKRLYAYAEWFNQNGGACFIIHPHCHALINKFSNNRFIIVKQSSIQRLIHDGNYLREIRSDIGVPDFYYSYGIPIYYKFGILNWFHLSNVLPLSTQKMPLSMFDQLKLKLLGKKIKANFKHADVISAESTFSLSLIDSEYATKMVVSVNGSDDELAISQTEFLGTVDNIATVVGTYRYKAIEDSYHVFEMLRANNSGLKLVIIGDEKNIPKWLRKNNNVVVVGLLQREDVIEYLRRTKYYISTTHIENSYNAASEGAFIANESFISNIGPHKELIAGMDFEEISVPNMKRPMLHIKGKDLSTANLKTWDAVITDMISHFYNRSI